MFIKGNYEVAMIAREELVEASALTFLEVPRLADKAIEAGLGELSPVRKLVEEELLGHLEDMHAFVINYSPSRAK